MLKEENIIPEIIKMAEECGVFSIRGYVPTFVFLFFVFFRPSAMKSGRPNGIMSVSSLSLSLCRTPPPPGPLADPSGSAWREGSQPR